MIKLFSVAILVAMFSCNNNNPSPATANVTAPVENIQPTKDQAERRKQSEAYCRLHNIPVYSNQNALFQDPEEKVVTRTKDEVTDRALALLYIGLKSEGLEKEPLAALDKRYDIMAKLSPEEKEYAITAYPTEQQKVNANWRYESLHVMLWALGFVDSLSWPGEPCNVAADVRILHNLTKEQFLQKAKLRTKKELLDQADLILRINWACTEARVKKNAMPGGVSNDIVQERHHSLNWLIKYMDQAWDDVSTDT